MLLLYYLAKKKKIRIIIICRLINYNYCTLLSSYIFSVSVNLFDIEQ